jgi:hypothetical protein
MEWFQLTGSNPTQPSNYSPIGSPSCLGEDQICAVQADNNGNNEPVLTEALKDEMIQALHDREPSANVQLRNA